MKKFKENFKKYIGYEIAIEYKACLYFYCILVFYVSYLLCQGVYTARILHMCEMILATYLMGYAQIYLLGNFDEAEKLTAKDTVSMVLCSVAYTVTSYLCGWFEKNIWVNLLFLAFMLFAYFCVYLLNRIKRAVDTENLNQWLAEYKRSSITEKLHKEDEIHLQQ